MNREKWKNKNFFEALKNSLKGIKYTFQNEKNLKIQSVFAILATGVGVFLKLTCVEFCILFITIGLVMFAELINTAVEFMLDLYSQEHSENIKMAKDISSGAVLITSIISVLVGIALFLPKILEEFL